MLLAGSVVKVGWRSNLDRDGVIRLACRALWEAADADSATGGPDMLRGVYPIVATITADGWAEVGDDELRAIFTAIEDGERSR
jgi:proteasome beta subunit